MSSDWVCNCGSALDGGHDHTSCGPPIPPREPASTHPGFARITERGVFMPGGNGKCDLWENDVYYGTLRRFKAGFFVGNSEWAVIGITAKDESALHDWRHFQQVKNDLVGREWEAVELYPAESRLVDPSNRFYLWCAPKGCFQFGFHHRSVDDGNGFVGQRPYPQEAP